MRRRTTVVALLTVLVLMASAVSFAQFPIPRPPRVPTPGEVLRDLGVRIPDLRRILDEPEAITSSLDDAVTGVPFLDDFDPLVTAPMSQLPFSGEGGFLVALPGVFELRAASFCLHAGTYGPGGGDGYLYAPLKGSLAGVVQDVLNRSMAHPEIEQHRVQSLVWAIEARAKVADMPRELREAAQALLTREQINRLNGGALGMVPEELFDQAFVDVPPEVRMVLEAQARLRDRLRQEVYDFDALQEIAVLTGDPPAAGGEGLIVPRGRWSWTPEGYFIRYLPNGYQETILQLYVPEPFQVVTDELGRIARLVDRYGATIEVRYAAGEAAVVAGDDAVRAWALEGLRLVSPAGAALELPVPAGSQVLTGLPAGGGQLTGAGRALYDEAQATLAQVRELARNVPGANPSSALLARVADMTHLCAALEAAAQPVGDAVPGIADWLNLGRKAWASELTVLLGGQPVSGALTVRPTGMADGVRLALLPPGQDRMLASLGLHTTWLAPLGAGGGKSFGPGNGGAMPGSRGRQRLGMSGNSRRIPEYRPPNQRNNEDAPPSSGSGDKFDTDRARKATDAISKGKQAADLAGGATGVAGVSGFAIPNYLFGKILDFNFDTWGKVNKALGQDPPRDDFTVIASPEPIVLPASDPAQALSPAHAAALDALAAALAENLAILRAAQLSEDRLGGAMAAGNDEWAMRQAAALVDFKRQAGAGMMVIAHRIDAVVAAIRDAGVSDLFLTAAAVEAYQARLRTEGFNEMERQAAALLGISDEELAQMRADRLAADPAELEGSMMQYWDELAEALWWQGRGWATLPAAVGGG